MWIFYATAQVLFYGSTQVTRSLFLEIASPARRKIRTRTTVGAECCCYIGEDKKRLV